jgi:hypothetical protein
MRTATQGAGILGVAMLAACAGGDNARVESAASHESTHEAPEGDPQAEFWAHLEALCGKAFAGELVEGTEEGDQALAGARLLIDAHTCDDDEIRIGFYAGEDRSRTWVFRRGDGLSLAHDHRDPDGTPHEVTGYGGPARDRGETTAQEFYADAHTAEVAPEAATNVWTLRIEPGERLIYSLRREVGDRRFRADFDLASAVEANADSP